jgi:hypothetical protein
MFEIVRIVIRANPVYTTGRESGGILLLVLQKISRIKSVLVGNAKAMTKGQITLPKSIRSALGLMNGS